jgi:tetratricopeptide (TPR) repeat protein
VVDLSDENDPMLEEAVQDARERVLSQPRSAKAWGRLGKLLLANGFGEDSRPCFAEAARLDPGDPRWPYLNGLAQQLTDPDGALPRFREAAELTGVEGPTASAVRLRYAEALMRAGKLPESKEILLDLVRRAPGDPRPALALGVIASDESDLATAERYLLRCMDSPWTRLRAARRLSALYQQREGPQLLQPVLDAAAEWYRQQARTLPNDQEGPDPIAEEYKDMLVGRRARLLRAEYLLRAGATAEGIALLRQLLEDFPNEPEASVKLGMTLAEQGQFREAEQVLRNSLRHGERVQTHYFLSVCAYHQAERDDDREARRQRLEEAARQARLALAGKPDHFLAHLYLGLALEGLGQRKEALKELEQAVRYGPDSVDPHLHLGKVLVAAGQYEKGFAHLDRAVELAGPRDRRPRETRDRLREQHPPN